MPIGAIVGAVGGAILMGIAGAQKPAANVQTPKDSDSIRD